MDAKAEAAEAELLHDERVEQAHEVGAGADEVALVRERPVERACPAELPTPFQDEHGAPGPGQVGGRRQPVVAPAHHHGVPATSGELGERAREPDTPVTLAHAHGAVLPLSPWNVPAPGRRWPTFATTTPLWPRSSGSWSPTTSPSCAPVPAAAGTTANQAVDAAPTGPVRTRTSITTEATAGEEVGAAHRDARQRKVVGGPEQDHPLDGAADREDARVGRGGHRSRVDVAGVGRDDRLGRGSRHAACDRLLQGVLDRPAERGRLARVERPGHRGGTHAAAVAHVTAGPLPPAPAGGVRPIVRAGPRRPPC